MMQYAAHHQPRQSTMTSLHREPSESDGMGIMHHRHHSPPQISPYHFDPDEVVDREASATASEPAVSALGTMGMMALDVNSNRVPSSTESDDEHFDHFDSDFNPLTVSMVSLPMMPTMPDQGSRSVPTAVSGGRVRSHSAKMKKSNLLRPKSTALWGDNDIDELHEEMSNQLQHLVTHSMSLDGSVLGHAPFAMVAPHSEENDVGGYGVGGRHSHSLSAGSIEEMTAIQVQGTETPKNLCSPQTANQWNDDDLDRQAEAIRMRLEQYRME